MTAIAEKPASPPQSGPAAARTNRLRDQLILTALAFLLALVIGAILMIVSDEQCRADLGYFFQAPSDLFLDSWYTVRDGYTALFEGSIYNFDNDGSIKGIFGPICASIYTATPLICAGLGIAMAFRCGLFNIGGQGQIIVGALASGYVGFAWSLPPVVHVLVAVVAGVLAGAAWGFIVGFLKARTGAHEVITTIMLNYVAFYGLKYVLALPGVVSGPGGQASKTVDGNARLPHLFGSSLPVNLGFVLAILAAIGCWWLLTRSSIGFRLRAVGANPAAARTAGMSVSGMTMLAMGLAGGLAGLSGVVLCIGGATSYQVTPAIDSGVGFDAITVALLGRNSPMGTVAAGLLFGILRQGGAEMQADTNVNIPVDLVSVIQALIIIFVAAPRLTRAIFRLKSAGLAGLGAATTNLTVSLTATKAAARTRPVVLGGYILVAALVCAGVFAFGDLAVVGFGIAVVLALVALAVARGRLAGRTGLLIAGIGVVVAAIVWMSNGTLTGLHGWTLLQATLVVALIPVVLSLIGESRSTVIGVVGLVIALVSLRLFGLGSASGKRATFSFSLPGAKYEIGDWTLSARPAVIVVCLVIAVFAGLAAARVVPAALSLAVSMTGLVLSFVVWNVAASFSGFNVVSLLQGTLFPAALPLILGALAGLIGERAGVVNVAIEGQFVFGAFLAAVAATMAGSVWVGLVGGALAGALVASVLAVMAIRYLVDQVIIGVVLNLLCTGLTTFLFIKMLSPHADAYNTPGYFHRYKIPFLGDLPIVGPVLFNGTIFLYGTYVIVGVVHYALFYTRWGLRVRAVGEHPRAADTVGIKVLRTRYLAVIMAGLIAGLGGAFLVIGTGNPGSFSLSLTFGKGFIALACVIFGRWSPKGAVAAALLFGFFDQMQTLLQGGPVDSNLMFTLPYIVTIVAVAGFVGRVRAPAADGQPYTSR